MSFPWGMSSSINPPVTINILSWNRVDELRITLQKLRRVDYPKDLLEIIVVDNASTDGSAEMVEHEFPHVRVLRMPKNVGIAGWNWGFANAHGKYVLVLDDDAHPERDAIRRMVTHFESDSQLGVIAFKIFEGEDKACVTSSWPEKVPTFWGCTAGLRTSMLNDTGYYDDQIFIYGFEVEFVMKALNAGYETKYLDDCVGYHRASLKHRAPQRSAYYFIRNAIWRVLKYYPAKCILPGLLLKVGFYGKTAFQARATSAFFKGLFDGMKGVPRALRQRTPLNYDVFSELQSRKLCEPNSKSRWDEFKKNFSYI